MADVTFARPYAKALFRLATAENSAAAWTDLLQRAALVAGDIYMKTALQHPKTTSKQSYQWFVNLCKPVLFKEGENLLQLLARRKKLILIPAIAKLFATYRAEQEKTLNVQVTSALPLKEQQQTALTKALSKRLNRQVVLTIQTDVNLLGGLIIKANDLVIDGSVRGKLQRLTTALLD